MKAISLALNISKAVKCGCEIGNKRKIVSVLCFFYVVELESNFNSFFLAVCLIEWRLEQFAEECFWISPPA